MKNVAVETGRSCRILYGPKLTPVIVLAIHRPLTLIATILDSVAVAALVMLMFALRSWAFGQTTYISKKNLKGRGLMCALQDKDTSRKK